LVGSVLVAWKLLSFRKSCTLEWYCVFGRITIELPLSARVIIALLSLSLVWMDFIILASGCVCGGFRGLFCFLVVMFLCV
jgi:hypothetical protein